MVNFSNSFIFLILHKFQESFFYKKSPSAKAKELGNVWLPQQNEFRNFCMSDETEKVYRKLEEVIGIC